MRPLFVLIARCSGFMVAWPPIAGARFIYMFGITFSAVSRAAAAKLSLSLTSQLLVGSRKFSICFLLHVCPIERGKDASLTKKDPQTCIHLGEIPHPRHTSIVPSQQQKQRERSNQNGASKAVKLLSRFARLGLVQPESPAFSSLNAFHFEHWL